MISKDQQVVLKQVISTWGIDAQHDMAIEEMSELTKAILKFRRAKTYEQKIECENNIIEEIADVKIMIAQLEMMFVDGGIDAPLVQEIIDSKIKRVEQKLNQ